MEKYTINSPALRDPKRGFYDVEEADSVIDELKAEIEKLKAKNAALIKSDIDKFLSNPDFIQKIKNNPPHNFDVVFEDGNIKKNYHKDGQMISMSDYCYLQHEFNSLRQENEALTEKVKALNLEAVTNAFKKLEQTEKFAEDFSALNKAYKAVMAENEALKKAQKWRDDWQNAIGAKNIVLSENGSIRLYTNAAPEGWCNWMQSAGAKFKIIEP